MKKEKDIIVLSVEIPEIQLLIDEDEEK